MSNDDLSDALRHSVKVLRAWQWMASLSNRPDDALAVLTREARSLVQLGLDHPGHVKEIGKLIVAYHHLISRLKHEAATGPQSV